MQTTKSVKNIFLFVSLCVFYKTLLLRQGPTITPGYGESYNIIERANQKLEDLYEKFTTLKETETYIVNPPAPGYTYAVFSASTPTPEKIRAVPIKAYNYVFYLPLTVMSWKRIGVKSIILLTGYLQSWKDDLKLQFVLRELIKQDVTLVFMQCPYPPSDFIARTARMYAATIIPWHTYVTPGVDDHLLRSTVLMMTDADIWPLRKDWFWTKEDSESKMIHTNINSYNGTPSEVIDYLNITVRRLSMTTVGMSVSDWKQFSPEGIKTYAELEAHLKNTFSNINFEKPARFEVHLDERILSYKWHQWFSTGKKKVLEERTRYMKYDRICRFHIDQWNISRITWRMIDVHLFRDGSNPVQWRHIQHILKLMYLGDPASYHYSLLYYLKFNGV